MCDMAGNMPAALEVYTCIIEDQGLVVKLLWVVGVPIAIVAQFIAHHII